MMDAPVTTRPAAAATRTAALICEAPPIFQLLESELKSCGLRVRQIDGSDYDRALATLRDDPPDLLEVAVLSRSLRSQCLCQAVGQNGSFGKTRLVVIQDSARAIDRRRALAFGARAYLQLPLPRGALGREIAPLLAGH
jgi:CheY-like chemotaxis protein